MATVFAPVHKLTAEEFQRGTAVTYLGQVHGTMAALRHMRARNRGSIVCVGSALAYRSVPLQSVYCGAKFAIRGFLDALRSELYHDEINVTLTEVDLPAVNTPQFDWARNKMGRKAQPVPPIFQPEVPARAIYFGAFNPRPQGACPSVRNHKLNGFRRGLNENKNNCLLQTRSPQRYGCDGDRGYRPAEERGVQSASIGRARSGVAQPNECPLEEAGKTGRAPCLCRWGAGTDAGSVLRPHASAPQRSHPDAGQSATYHRRPFRVACLCRCRGRRSGAAMPGASLSLFALRRSSPGAGQRPSPPRAIEPSTVPLSSVTDAPDVPAPVRNPPRAGAEALDITPSPSCARCPRCSACAAVAFNAGSVTVLVRVAAPGSPLRWSESRRASDALPRPDRMPCWPPEQQRCLPRLCPLPIHKAHKATDPSVRTHGEKSGIDARLY